MNEGLDYIETDEIQFGKKKDNLLKGYIYLVGYILAVMIFMVISIASQNILPVIFVAMGFWYFGYKGFFFVRKYLSGKRSLSKAIEKYGENNLCRNIKNNTLKKINCEGVFLDAGDVFFTDRLIICPSRFICSYEEIAWAYTTRDKKSKRMNTSLIIRLYNGQHVIVGVKLSVKDAKEAMSIISSHSSNILRDESRYCKIQYKKRVRDFKKGIIKINDVDISEKVPEYDYSGIFPVKVETGEADKAGRLVAPRENNGPMLMLIGFGTIVLEIVNIFVTMYIDTKTSLNIEVYAIMVACMALPILSVGLCLLLVGTVIAIVNWRKR